jgi:hypothetical protein
MGDADTIGFCRRRVFHFWAGFRFAHRPRGLVTAIIVAISLEDSAAMKAGMFLPDEKKGEGAS